MRTRGRFLALLGTFVLLIALGVATPAMALKVSWVKSQVTTGSVNMVGARVSSQLLSWSTDVFDEPASVFLKQLGGATSQLTSGGPIWVSGNRAVWYAEHPGSSQYSLVTQATDEGAPTMLVEYSNGQPPISIDGDRIAWPMYTDNVTEVFTWAEGDAAPTRVTNNMPGAYGAWGVQVSGDRLVWRENDAFNGSYYTWEVGDTQPRFLTHPGVVGPGGIRVSGDRVVYSAQVNGGDAQVFTWKAGDTTPTQVTDTAGDHNFADVSGDRLVWNERVYADDGDARQVFTKLVDEEQPTQVTAGVSDCNYIQIDGDRISWTNYRDGEGPAEALVTWQVGDKAPSVIATNLLGLDRSSQSDEQFTLSGDKMSWIGDVSGVQQVFLATAGARLDWEPPITTADVRHYYGVEAEISVDATDDPDGLGVAHTYMVVDGGSVVETTSITVTGIGEHTVSYWSVDVAGNVEVPTVKTFSIVDDITGPTVTTDLKSAYADWATIHINANDGVGGIGVDTIWFALDGHGAWEYWDSVGVDEWGVHTIQYWATDLAGNYSPIGSATFTILDTPSTKGTPSYPVVPDEVTHGVSFTTMGSVVRHTSGTYPVTLQFYRYQSGKWVLKKSITAKVSNFLKFSKYYRTTSVPYAGEWRVRARHKISGTHYHYSGYSYIEAS